MRLQVSELSGVKKYSPPQQPASASKKYDPYERFLHSQEYRAKKKENIKHALGYLGFSSTAKSSATIKPAKKEPPAQPRTLRELKKALLQEPSITPAEREIILKTTKDIAGYRYKDWQAEKTKKFLLTKSGSTFSDPDKRAIKKYLGS